ncbi:hypothetical protein TNCV_3024611 [Trichonephila clavipes]|nr:hypothetical protein TNCV_3024611 [Trichonephila clavipes]
MPLMEEIIEPMFVPVTAAAAILSDDTRPSDNKGTTSHHMMEGTLFRSLSDNLVILLCLRRFNEGYMMPYTGLRYVLLSVAAGTKIWINKIL